MELHVAATMAVAFMQMLMLVSWKVEKGCPQRIRCLHQMRPHIEQFYNKVEAPLLHTYGMHVYVAYIYIYVHVCLDALCHPRSIRATEAADSRGQRPAAVAKQAPKPKAKSAGKKKKPKAKAKAKGRNGDS